MRALLTFEKYKTTNNEEVYLNKLQWNKNQTKTTKMTKWRLPQSSFKIWKKVNCVNGGVFVIKLSSGNIYK